MSAITFNENSVEKRQVFWPWSSFRMSRLHGAADRLQRARANFLALAGSGRAAAGLFESLHLLVDRGIQEHRQ